MKFEMPLEIYFGCQDVLTNKKLAKMICDALLEGYLPKKFYPGSTLKISINLEFSIPDFVGCQL